VLIVGKHLQLGKQSCLNEMLTYAGLLNWVILSDPVINFISEPDDIGLSSFKKTSSTISIKHLYTKDATLDIRKIRKFCLKWSFYNCNPLVGLDRDVFWTSFTSKMPLLHCFTINDNLLGNLVLKLCPLAHLKHPKKFKHFHKKSGIPEKSGKMASLIYDHFKSLLA